MSKKAKPVQESRREFLKDVAVVGGAAALATVAGGATAGVESQKGTPALKKSTGYHETPHILTYYERARQ